MKLLMLVNNGGFVNIYFVISNWQIKNDVMYKFSLPFKMFVNCNSFLHVKGHITLVFCFNIYRENFADNAIRRESIQ